MIARSKAGEYGPQGIHVAHVVIDDGVGGDRLLNAFERFGEDGMLAIDAVVDNYRHLHRQHPSAWTHEIDLRPLKESF